MRWLEDGRPIEYIELYHQDEFFRNKIDKLEAEYHRQQERDEEKLKRRREREIEKRREKTQRDHEEYLYNRDRK